VTRDDAGAESHGAHRDSHIPRVLRDAVRPLGFVGIAAASQIDRKEGASARQAFGNADEI
jgi:hypothetical protein